MNPTTSLTDLLAAPVRVDEIPVADVPAMLATLAGLSLALSARLAAPAPEPSGNGTDELLTVEQAAALLGVDRSFIWRKSRRADWHPFTVHISRKVLRIKRRGLEKWLARQRAR